jgi:bifunctional DNA-binding transcriptional regulator/antitoxin component of YhaV-PrlF toxin-antitoxin module
LASMVDERGMIVIDSDIREKLGIVPGIAAYQRLIDGRLEIVFLPAEHDRSLFGALRREGEEPLVINRADVEEAVGEALPDERTDHDRHNG